jgi:Flp pilus assembly pilin Flp
MELVRRFFKDDEGAETVEYALVLGLMALAAVAGIGAAGKSVSTWWQNLSGTVATIPGGT